MSEFSRRDFLKLTSLSAATAIAGTQGVSAFGRNRNDSNKNYSSEPKPSSAKGTRVLVIGGGFGGATCAKYLKRADAGLTVALIEPNEQFVTCPASNYVIAGLRELATITQSYDMLKQQGIEIVRDAATTIEPAKRRVKLKGGMWLSYDRLVVAPGIEYSWGTIRGYDEKAANTMPHAWKAGAQTMRLRRQLEGMPSGGRFIIVAPANPFRCPPGPYERASLVAYYLKRHKPKAKVIILDAKDAFSKQALFVEAWGKLYPGMIEWVPASQGGKVVSVNTKSMTVEGEFDKYRGDVVNVIPPQTAGRIALHVGLADDSGWCPVNPMTLESKKHKGIYVIGDAAIADALPKSGFAANSEAKIAAAAIVADLHGQPPADASYVNTCYSLVAPDYAISVAGVYRATAKGIEEVADAGGTSPKDATLEFRAQEAKYARGWYAGITADTWQ